MKKVILIGLMILSLLMTMSLSPLVRASALISPISPFPSQSDAGSSDSHKDDEANSAARASDAVWVPQTGQSQFLVKTSQVGLGWWDAAGKLHVELNRNGSVIIPLQDAVMISIPADATGVSVPPGWQRFQRPENGEWVIIRTK
ncbi:hypothetical protein BH10CHL1_BH10CHL1_28770 [soil metagenome]